MEREMRGFQTRDIFSFSKILRKIGLKELKKCFSADDINALIKTAKGSGEKFDMDQIGLNVLIDAMDHIVSKAPECERDVYAFIGGLYGMKAEEIGEIDAAEMVGMIEKIVKHPSFSDFFTQVSRFMK